VDCEITAINGGFRVTDDASTIQQAEAYLRAHRKEQYSGIRLHPIMGPQWNVGILQSSDDGTLYAAGWKTCPDGSCDVRELAPMPEDLIISEEYDGGQVELWTDWHLAVLRVLDEAGDDAQDRAAEMIQDGGWITLAVFTVATNTYLPVVTSAEWPPLYDF
jgi:hypothetical protein